MAWDPITETELEPGYAVLKHMRQAWNCLKYLYGALGTAIASGVQNSSFEIDSDADSVPDGWTFVAAPGGVIGLDTTTPAHGAQAVKIIHPGGAGNGGGTLTSDYVACGPLVTTWLGFIHWASAAGMKNQVIVKFYTAAKVYISSTTLYTSTANPTSATYFCAALTPPATARYYKLDLIGGNADTNVAGTAYFDAVGEAPASFVNGVDTPFTHTAQSTSSTTWADAGSVAITLPFRNMNVCLIFKVSATFSTGFAGVRYRCGSDYSNDVYLTDPAGQVCLITLRTAVTTGSSITIYTQGRDAGGGGVTITKSGSACQTAPTNVLI